MTSQLRCMAMRRHFITEGVSQTLFDYAGHHRPAEARSILISNLRVNYLAFYWDKG